MNKKLIFTASALALALTGCDKLCTSNTKSSLVTDKDKYSYALGAHFGNQARFQLIERDSLDIDIDAFVQAFKARYNQDTAHYLMNDSLMIETIKELSNKQQAEKVKKDSIIAATNLAKGEAFLAENKTKDSVITTNSGLQYKVTKEGDGIIPGDNFIVKVHYTGTLLDGTKFDSSIDRGEPLEFPLDAVIPGWTEMLKLMKVGSKVTAWVPYNLAYGSHGNRVIPANSMLIFDMELIDAHPVEEAPKAEAKPAAKVKKAETKPATKATAAAPAATQATTPAPAAAN